jgi:hypothetical protein
VVADAGLVGFGNGVVGVFSANLVLRSLRSSNSMRLHSCNTSSVQQQVKVPMLTLLVFEPCAQYSYCFQYCTHLTTLGMPLHAQLIHTQPLLIASFNLCNPLNLFLCGVEAGMKRRKEVNGRAVNRMQLKRGMG